MFTFVKIKKIPHYQNVFQSGCTMLYSHGSGWIFLFSISSPVFGVSVFWTFVILSRYVVVPHCCFNLYFPKDIYIERIFICLLASACLLWWDVFLSLLPIFCWMLRLLCIFWITVIIGCVFCKYFPLTSGLSSDSLGVDFLIYFFSNFIYYEWGHSEWYGYFKTDCCSIFSLILGQLF